MVKTLSKRNLYRNPFENRNSSHSISSNSNFFRRYL